VETIAERDALKATVARCSVVANSQREMAENTNDIVMRGWVGACASELEEALTSTTWEDKSGGGNDMEAKDT